MSEQPDGTGPRHGPPASDAGEGAAPPPPDGTAPGAAPDGEAPGTGAPSPAGSGPEQGARRPSRPADPPGAPARPDTAGPPASGAPAGAPAPSEGPDPAGSPAPPAAPGAARTGAAPAPRAGAPGHAGPGRPGPGNGAPPQPPQAGPPAHQGPPAGPPPRGPQGPSDAGQTPEAPRANRGCATAAVAVLALGALVLVGAGVWAVVGLIGPGGYEKVPECAVAEGETLDELVPEAEAEVDDRIDGMEQEGREGEQCRWASGEDSAHTPSAVRVVMVRTGTEGGSAGEEAAAELLDGASQQQERTALSGLGDEAYSWYDAEVEPLGWGCVGARTANLYVETCYSSAADYGRTEPIPDADMVDGAKRLAREVLTAAEEGKG